MSGFAPLQDTGTGRSSAWSATGQAAHVVLDSGYGTTAGVTQYGYLRTTNEPNFWFTEPFDSLDTTNRWSTKLATGTAAVTNGVLVISSSTTASAYGGVFTQPTFAPNGVNFVAFGLTQVIPNVAQANTLRFWGWGSVQTTPTVTAPIVNGCGFELSATGVLTAVVYQNGTRVQNVATGVTLTNNVPFYSAMARRSDRLDFYVNSTDVPVATILIPTLFVSTLPFQAIAINAATPPAAAAQMNILAFGIGDTGQNANALADPTNPWIRASVKRASTAAAATDPALVVSMAGANSATKVGDGTNNAAIKAASTAAAAADPSLVVALHPSSPLNGQSATGSAVAGNPVRIAGSDGTNTRNVLTDSNGYMLSPYPLPVSVTDVASAALTTTTTTSAITPSFGQGYQVVIPVTATSGTPTLDVAIEESDDAGTNWLKVYDFPRITATGVFRSPVLRLRGNRIRYVQTVGGGAPSVTRSVVRLQISETVPQISQLIDRTITLTSLNSTTPSINVQNCRNAQLVINIGAATTAPTLQLQGSDDNGTTWYAVGSTLLAVASSTVQLTTSNIQTQLLRAIVTSAGNTVTAGYVLVKGF